MTNNNEGTTPETIADLTKFLESFPDSSFYRRTSYRGYILIYQPFVGDCHIFDRQGELIDVTGLGITGAQLYIDQWHNPK